MYYFSIYVNDRYSFYNIGRVLSKIVRPNFTIFLNGDIGVGKTFLLSGFIREFVGSEMVIKSPTYSIYESYFCKFFCIYHIDLYRIKNISELKELCLNDYLDDKFLFLVEWAEKYYKFLPAPDLEIYIYYSSLGRKIIIKSNYIPIDMLLS